MYENLPKMSRVSENEVNEEKHLIGYHWNIRKIFGWIAFITGVKILFYGTDNLWLALLGISAVIFGIVLFLKDGK